MEGFGGDNEKEPETTFTMEVDQAGKTPEEYQQAKLKVKGGEALEGLINDIYDSPGLGARLRAEMLVYACQRFDVHVQEDAAMYWTAITQALRDTLYKYPLTGRHPFQFGY